MEQSLMVRGDTVRWYVEIDFYSAPVRPCL